MSQETTLQETGRQAADGDALLRVENLVKYFPVKSGRLLPGQREYVHAVEDVSLQVRQGETLGLVGETGCGKSTLARCAARLYPVTSGRIFFGGRDITTLSPRRMRPLDPDDLPGSVRVAEPATPGGVDHRGSVRDPPDRPR
jgi:ABC-type glutathione transport system ATPase component